MGALPNVTFEDLKATQAATKAMPTWKDIKSAFGEKAVTEKKINLDVATREGKANRGKLLDMMMKPWEKEADRGILSGSRIEKTTLAKGDGRGITVPVELADGMARRDGLHHIPKWGNRRRRLMTITRDGRLLAHE